MSCLLSNLCSPRYTFLYCLSLKRTECNTTTWCNTRVSQQLIKGTTKNSCEQSRYFSNTPRIYINKNNKISKINCFGAPQANLALAPLLLGPSLLCSPLWAPCRTALLALFCLSPFLAHFIHITNFIACLNDQNTSSSHIEILAIHWIRIHQLNVWNLICTTYSQVNYLKTLFPSFIYPRGHHSMTGFFDNHFAVINWCIHAMFSATNFRRFCQRVHSYRHDAKTNSIARLVHRFVGLDVNQPLYWFCSHQCNVLRKHCTFYWVIYLHMYYCIAAHSIW